MKTGDKVRIVVSADCPLRGTSWWPEGEVTGTIQKFFKNGNIQVAVDQLRNQSKDKRRSMVFEACDLHPM